MCHQTIEKIFKAYRCSKIKGTSPMSHNLINIAQSCGLNVLMSEEQKLFISEIDIAVVVPSINGDFDRFWPSLI